MVETISTQYTPREMLEALNIVVPVNTFLLDRLVKKTSTHMSRYLEIDVKKNGQKKAAYVSRVGPAEVVAKTGFDSKIHMLPYTKQKMVLTFEDLDSRDMSSTVYEAGTYAQRMNMKLGEWLEELRQRIVRLEEYQLAQGLITGKTTVSGNGANWVIDYDRDSDNSVTLTGTARWAQTATRDILGDIRAASVQMNKIGVDGGDPSILILGGTAGLNFMDEAQTTDTALKNTMDMRRLERGEIKVEYLRGQNVTYLGNIRDIGVDIDVVVYKGKWEDDAGAEQFYIGANDAIFVNESLRVEKHYSVISNLKSQFIGRMFPSTWEEPDGSAEYLQLESGPLAALHEPDATYYLNTEGGA